MTRDEFEVWLEGVRAEVEAERAEREEPCYEVAWGELRAQCGGRDRWIPRGVVACDPTRPSADLALRGWIGPNETAAECALALAREQGVALVLSVDSPDGWAVVDLDVTP